MPGTTTLVSNATQLLKVAKTARAGDTILLASGNYGDVSLANLRPTGNVTIKSANPDADAVFRTLKLTNLSNFIFEDFDIRNPIAVGAPRTAAVRINAATNITFSGIDMSGSLNGSAWDDAHGMMITGSNHVSILDSTFRQLDAAIVVGRSSDVIVAGNTVTEAREGVVMGAISGGLFELNRLSNMQPNLAAGEHADFFQVHDGSGAAPSDDLVFRSNVMIGDGMAAGMHGIYIYSERDAAENIHHSNITIENNFYEGAARHGISVSHVDNLVVANNTVLYSGSGGLVPAIMVREIIGGVVKDNVATLLIDVQNSGSTNLAWSNNIDVWDPMFKVGIAKAALFAATPTNEIDFSTAGPLAGSVADVSGAGFRGVAQIGNLSAGVAAQIAAYVPLFDHHFVANHIA